MNFKPEFNFEHLCYCVPRQYKNYATFLYAQSLVTELIMGGLMTISVELERVIIVKKKWAPTDGGADGPTKLICRVRFAYKIITHIKIYRYDFLKDKKNVRLRTNLLTGILSAEKLAKVTLTFL